MEQDPRAILQKAEKAAQGASSGFSLFGSKTDKLETAAELYTQAANAYKIQKSNKEAGQCFEAAAKLQTERLNEPDDAANSNVEAYKVYKKDQPKDAARCLGKAISQYTAKGNFRRAATHQQNLAELYENDLQDPKGARDAYTLAADWFEGDNAMAMANKLLLKVADLAAIDSDYATAIANYERVARSALNNDLMKYSIKEYYLKGGICHLATGDTIAINRALESYRDADNTFSSTREHQLLVDLTEAVEEGDGDKFADKLFQYDKLSKLDNWKTTMLLRVKEAIEQKGEDFS